MKRNIGRWTAREIPRENAKWVSRRESGEIGLPETQATPREVLKRNAKRVSKSDASRGLVNKCHSRVSERCLIKGLYENNKMSIQVD